MRKEERSEGGCNLGKKEETRRREGRQEKRQTDRGCVEGRKRLEGSDKGRKGGLTKKQRKR